MLPAFISAAAFLITLFVSACESDSSSGGDEAPDASENPRLRPGLQFRSEPSFLRHRPTSPCPEDMARIERSCVDRFEARLLVDGHPHPHNRRPPTDAVYLAASAANFFPQAYISKDESEQACRHAGKRLCTLEEWLRACKGSRHLLYSYGNQEEKGRCNKAKPHLMLQLFKEKDPMLWTYEDHFNNPILNETPGFLAKSGEYYGCMSDYGIFDMVGNLHEWVADTVDGTLPTKIHLNSRLEEKYKDNHGFGIFMGGFYSTTSEHGSGCEFITIGHEPAYHDYSTGFRCCKDAGLGDAAAGK